jgi:predicted ATPase/DNA-binding CsgD family transcriptional regulator
VGKTRLAVESARQVLPEYSDGVWLVDLAALSDPNLVAQVSAAALGIREAPGRSVLETLIDVLSRRHALLILDNCEHLVQACARIVDDLLRSGPALRILATARQSLGVPGETAWRVPSLGLPWPARPQVGESVTRFEAPRLFVERARAALPDFAVTDENGATIASLCFQLDGIPLAIELAAARIKALALDDIETRLQDRLRLLTGGSRTALPRHQTLRGTLDWSYELLSEAERVLFRRLAVFAGGWTLEAAETVCAGTGIDVADVVDLLSQLVDKSLVIAEPRAGRARYRLLETTRQYASELVAAAGEVETLRQAHTAFFLDLAERAELRGPPQVEWVERLDRERDNLRAALQWVGERGEHETELWEVWWVRGYLSEGRRWSEEALARSGNVISRARARALHGAGIISGVRGDFPRCEAWLAQSLAAFRELGDAAGAARSLADLGSTACFQGETGRGLALCSESLEAARETDAAWELAYALYSQGFNRAWHPEHHEAAADFLTESATRFRALEDRRGLAHTLSTLAGIVRARGDAARAIVLGRESVDLFWQLGESFGLLGAFVSLATSASQQGRPADAAQLLGACAALDDSLGGAMLPPWRADFDATTQAAKAALGEPGFDARHELGRALSLPDAVAYARLDQPTEPGPSVNDGKDEGPLGLTRRQLEVISLLAQGLSNRQIGAALVIAEGTAALHVKHILRRLGLDSRSKITAWAIRRGLGPVPAAAR